MTDNRNTLYIRPNVIYISRELARLLGSTGYSIEILEPGKCFKISPDGPVKPFPSDPNSIARKYLDSSFPIGRYSGRSDGKGFIFEVSAMVQPEIKQPFFRNNELKLPNEKLVINEPMNKQTINRMLQLLRTRRHENLEIVGGILRSWRNSL